MLRALHRLLRPAGRIAYTTIHVTPGLPPLARRRAHRAGPRAVASRTSQRALLSSAGFIDIEHLDLTAEFAVTARAGLDERDAHAEELAAACPPGVFDERQREGRAQLAAVEAGLLRRGMFSASKPRRKARVPTPARRLHV